MRALHERRTILVPIFGGDIDDDTLTAASALLDAADTQLVLLHVSPSSDETALAPGPSQRPVATQRWHRLASASPDHTFLDAVVGDPVEEVLAEAQRFDSDAIVLGAPDSSAPEDAWIRRAIAQLVRAAPRQVCLAGRSERPRRAHRAARVSRRASYPDWRPHGS
jgi:nucleotide-binding universal stress UspA family protein